MRELAPGERVGLDDPLVEIDVDSPQMDARAGQLGAVVVALDASGKAPATFAPLAAVSDEIRPGAGFVENGVLRIDLPRLPAEVERLLMIAYIVGGIGSGVSFADFERLEVTTRAHRLRLDLTGRREAALILVEVYRRNGAWRMSAGGQGFVGGIGAAAHALGIDIPVPRGPDRPPSNDGDGGPPLSGSFYGSGFAIDRRHILTNAHVVDGVRTVNAASEQLSVAAEIVFADPRNDVALLRVERDLPGAARFRDTLDIHLGEDVVVLGFPLQGLLGSGPQASGGNVSSLCGIGNDTGVLQFTAPIASGNSGGPILDTNGHVIGLVHSSLNVEQIRRHGSNAENVNFGAKAALVRAFLATTGVTPQVATGGRARNRADIVKEARAWLYRIRCEA